MAPKKASAASKGKAVVQGGEPAATQQVGDFEPALTGFRFKKKAQLEKVRRMAASATNEHGATVLKPADNSFGDFYPIFMHTLFAGLVPPFSDFFLAILERYQIQVLHLHPNSILVLAIFTYLCEAYIGIPPLVDLFRSFYALRFTANKERSGCVSFRIAEGMKGTYIPIARNGENIVTNVTKRVEDFRKRWFLMKFGSRSAFFELPEAPPMKWASWSSKALKGATLGPVVRRLKDLREAGLTGQMVAKDFVKRRIAPLQRHADAMWLYSNQRTKCA